MDAPKRASCRARIADRGEALGCPVCRARLRGTRACSRCGADLEPLMLLAGQAWRHRNAARAAIHTEDWTLAAAHAARAEALCATPQGRRLYLLAVTLDRTGAA